MTKYIKENEIDETKLVEIANALKDGNLVIFKTDTVYGIGTNAFDENACKRIYEVKGRPSEKPLCVLISETSMLEKMVDSINEIEQKLIDTFWPGPLTIKFKKKENSLPSIVSAGDEFVRVRLLNEGLPYSLIDASKVPIVSPSANLSGSPTGTNVENIMKDFDGKVDYIIDSGDVSDDTTSTIVEVNDDKIIIIREGKIKKEEIEKIAPAQIL